MTSSSSRWDASSRTRLGMPFGEEASDESSEEEEAPPAELEGAVIKNLPVITGKFSRRAREGLTRHHTPELVGNSHKAFLDSWNNNRL